MKRLLGLLVVVLLAGARAPLTVQGDVQRMTGVACGPDSFYTLTSQGIQVWNAETGLFREMLKVNAQAFALAPDGQSLAVVEDRQIRLLPSGRKLFTVEDKVGVIAFNREGGLLACGSSGNGPVWLMEVGTGRLRWKLGDEVGRASSTVGLAFTADSRLLAAGAAGGVYLWDLSTGALRFKFPGVDQSVAFSPDGKRLYAVQGGLSCFDVTSGLPVWNVKGEGSALAISPDGTKLAWAGAGLRMVDALTGEGKAISGTGKAVSAAFTPDGRRVLTGGEGGARVWSLARWLGGMAVWPGAEWASYAADGSYQCSSPQFLRGGAESPEGVAKGWLP